VSLSAGDRLDSYEIVAPLGVGGMGEIYVAPFPGPGPRHQVSTDGGARAARSAPSRFERLAQGQATPDAAISASRRPTCDGCPSS